MTSYVSSGHDNQSIVYSSSHELGNDCGKYSIQVEQEIIKCGYVQYIQYTIKRKEWRQEEEKQVIKHILQEDDGL